jgi:glycosyltransferase involved in cell wall biosynthesis
MKRLIKASFRKLGLEVTRHIPPPLNRTVSLKAKGVPRGNVLLALWIKPFLLKNGDPVSNAHAHNWRSLQIAKTFLDFGFNVDVIDYLNSEFVPRKEYAFFFAFRTHFEKLARRLNDTCVKIVYLDTAHCLFNNNAAFARGLNLQQRKGVTLGGLRIIEFNRAIECADYGIISGNQFTLETYRYSNKPIFHVAYPSCAVYPWPAEKDFDSCRRDFLWFGSSGFVHKGLDLVLEAFAEMPDYRLHVCGPIQEERDFETVYYRELYERNNVQTHGWLDVESLEFRQTTNQCIALVYPSCSEGGGGSVLTCMHAGLIPIVSYQSSVDVGGFGVLLKQSSIEEIKNAVKLISELPGEELKSRSRRTWEFSRAHHTQERFAEDLKSVIGQVTQNRLRSDNRESPC